MDYLLFFVLLNCVMVLTNSSHTFESGYSYRYMYSSTVNLQGKTNLTTIVHFQVRHVNVTDGGDSMNQISVESVVQHTEQGYMYDNPRHWVLSKTFLFQIKPDGLIEIVHTHPEDHDEVVTIKKAITGIFSAKVKHLMHAHDRATTAFQSTELDHTGKLDHKYNVVKSSDGIRVRKEHSSVDKVKRRHEKNMHYDTDGSLRWVSANDHIELQTPKGNQNTRKPLPGEYTIQDTEDGEFPQIVTSASTHVRLLQKRVLYAQEHISHEVLIKESILVTKKLGVKKKLGDEIIHIESLLKCTLSDESTNGTECVIQLKNLLNSLEDTGYKTIAEKELNTSCVMNDTSCEMRRNVFIDLVARKGDNISQELVAKYILNKDLQNEKDIQRCLYHCAVQEKPVRSIVLAVEKLCFGYNDSKHGGEKLSNTQRRACLVMGSLSKWLHRAGYTNMSDHIVHRLETWLQIHNETKSAGIIKQGRPMHVIEKDPARHHHIVTKTTMIHALGNAARNRSLRHITSYMESNKGTTSWRLSAIHSLRLFTCNESATALLQIALDDNNEVVRETAYKAFSEHPQGLSLSSGHRDRILSKRYTYRTVARVRRGINLSFSLLTGLFFEITLPGIEWEKTIGNRYIGISFGLAIRDRMELELKMLEGHFELDVYKNAFSTVHVGLLGFNIDIVAARLCYKGHIGYDMNILKEFGINDLSDLANLVDNLVKTIVDPVVSAVNGFKNLINFFRNGGIQKIFDTIVEVVKNLPTILVNLAKTFVDYVIKAFDFSGLPWIELTKKIIRKVSDFVSDVQHDVVSFYKKIVDIINITIPYIGKQIWEGVKIVIDGVKSFLSNPINAIGSLTKGISKIKMAIVMFLNTKNDVLETLGFTSGKTPFWMGYQDELKEIIEDVRNLFEMFFRKEESTDDKSEETSFSSKFSDGFSTMSEQAVDIKDILLKLFFNAIDGELKGIWDIAKPFYDVFKDITDLVQAVKSAYTKLKSIVETVRGLVSKLTGPKFHRKFPKKRREADEKCGQGFYPTYSGEFKSLGVGLLLGAGSSIVNPVAGLVFKKTTNQVLIMPNHGSFRQYEIVIHNIKPVGNVSTKGTYFDGGSTIGVATRSNCQPNFIHLAVRKKATGSLNSEDEYDYVNPEPFLDRGIPIPQWIEECNDFFFKHIFETVDAGALDQKGAKKKSKKVNRKSTDNTKKLNGMNWDVPSFKIGAPTFEGMTSPLGKVPDINFGSMKSQLQDMGNLKSLFLNNVKNPFYDNNINSFTIGDIRGLLSPQLQLKLDGIITLLFNMKRMLPTVNVGSLSLSQIKMHMKNADSFNTGDWLSIAATLILQIEDDCPVFKHVLAKGLGLFCKAHEDCLGLTCGIPINYGMKQHMVSVDMDIDVCSGTLKITSTTLDDIQLDGVMHSITLFELEEEISFNAYVRGTITSSEISLDVKVSVCKDEFMSCLITMDIINNAVFHINTADCAHSGINIHAENWVSDLSLGEFLQQLSELNLMSSDILSLTNDIRDRILETMDEDTSSGIGGSPFFQDSDDQCVAVDIPIPKVVIEFFEFHLLVMVGPIPLILRFGGGGTIGMDINLDLCYMSMSLKAALSPYLAGKVWGSLALSLGMFEAGIQLNGYILETGFPFSGSITFNKFPLSITAKMDLRITPLRMQLNAFCRIFVIFKFINLFQATLWSYRSPAIQQNIFTIGKVDKDISPPDVTQNTINPRIRRSVSPGCKVSQINGRDNEDTAFSLEASFSDDTSKITVEYAIGTQHGGTNIVGWTVMGGPSLNFPTTDIPNGIPIQWTVRATNSQGGRSYTHCMLSTYDNTLPDGRVDHSYPYSSHPKKLSATVNVFDDSSLVDSHRKALGLSSGQFGSEVVSWQTFSLKNRTSRDDETTDLKYFSVAQSGRLTVSSFQSSMKENLLLCVAECLEYTAKCISFDYEYHSEKCDLHQYVVGPSAELRISGTYKHYERLGVGHTSFIEYDSLYLDHGTVYFINVNITNILGYEAFLQSTGTIVDFTPPDTAHLGEGFTSVTTADKCTAALTQRCIEVTWKPNHRQITDGDNGSAVFNGHKPLVDTLYTLSNHYISVSFNGFYDNQTGIWGYTWFAGKDIGESNIVNERNPHGHITHSKYWTYNGYVKGLHLTDGYYYVSVRALNNVVFGGALVTTVKHSSPVAIDTTPPWFGGISEIYYDEDFDLLGIYYQASDSLSSIMSMDFGLGKTKHDVLLRGYSGHAYMDRKDPYVALKDLGLPPGVPAWIRLRAENNVKLFTAGHGTKPILIDKTPPYPGTVLDGNVIKKDMKYQSDTSTLCAQWPGFYDPESGISVFVMGVGGVAELDNIVKFHNYTHHTKMSCIDGLKLQHNTTYYTNITAYNSALNKKKVTAVSNGVLVDITDPKLGWFHDGVSPDKDQQFSSASATKSCIWGNFSDSESGINYYRVEIYINDEVRKEVYISTAERVFTDHSLAIKHLDNVKFGLTAVNGAGLKTKTSSSGFLVDHTAPVMQYLQDNANGRKYQKSDNSLDIAWGFVDLESDIKAYQYSIIELKNGIKSLFWPKDDKHKEINNPEELFSEHLSSLPLSNGAMYSVHVIAINQALMSTSHVSSGIIVDNTPPVVLKVKVCLSEEEEELDENGLVEHASREFLTVSWVGLDLESGISEYHVAIGVTPEDMSISGGFINQGMNTDTTLTGLSLQVFSESGILYYVHVRATNGAGSMSTVLSSKAILVVSANIPGIVYDGRILYEDTDFTYDGTSVAMSFEGFKSEACNIVRYEWAVGTEPFFSDVVSYTDNGVVLHNESHGQAHLHVELTENIRYYISVRAKTGHNCHEEFIVSSSDGFIVDTSPPTIAFNLPANNDTLVFDSNIYQTKVDTLDMAWTVVDNTEVQSVRWTVGSFPYQNDIHKWTADEYSTIPAGIVHENPGDFLFVTVSAIDKTGNSRLSFSKGITADITPPVLYSLTCDQYISVVNGKIQCSWAYLEEKESLVSSLSISVGKSEMSTDVVSIRNIHINTNYWQFDIHDTLKTMTEATIFVTFNVKNVLGHVEQYSREILVDRSPPVQGTITIVTRMDDKREMVKQTCQIPQSYVEVSIAGFEDDETGIGRIEVALGTKKEQSDIKEFYDIKISEAGWVFIGHLNLKVGQTVFATTRVYNKVGLYTVLTSSVVYVSPNPYLTVLDGTGDTDLDFQKELNMLQGNWFFSDPCPMILAEWSVEDLAGNVLQEYAPILGKSQYFYNDELSLQNGYVYYNKIQIVDALYRKYAWQSDGITVRIQTPSPADVRDGLSDDINYQYNVDKLSVNWDEFGEKNSNDPTQTIVYYLVAIGNDRRSTKTVTNIHFYVNVGLNTSYTFENLNLTSRTVSYFANVRAYSKSGSYEEAFSNGIRVGFRDGIFPGSVDLENVQSSTSTISLSWSAFISDIGIKTYKIGLSSKFVVLLNFSAPITKIGNVSYNFDVLPLRDVGMDTYIQLTHLTLSHGHTYWAIVIGIDEAGMFRAVISNSILIDTTNPNTNGSEVILENIKFEKNSKQLAYIVNQKIINVAWANLTDTESGIRSHTVTLLGFYACPLSYSDPLNLYRVTSMDVTDATKATFYDLLLSSEHYYYINVTAENYAGLKTSIRSPFFRVDSTAPLSGTIKVGDDVKSESKWQSSLTDIKAVAAIAGTQEAHDCRNQKQILHGANESWTPLPDQCLGETCVTYSNNKYDIFIGWNTQLTKLLKGGLKSSEFQLLDGNYTGTFKAARGKNTATTFFLASSYDIASSCITPPIPDDFEDVTFSAKSPGVSSSEIISTLPTTDTITGVANISTTPANFTNKEKPLLLNTYGFGVSILGQQQKGSRNYDGLFWVVDMNGQKDQWFTLEDDPTNQEYTYTLNVEEVVSPSDTSWNVKLIINSESYVVVTGIKLQSKVSLFFQPMVTNGYTYPITDPFNPYRSSASLSNVFVPLSKDKPCLHLKGFYEGESMVKELWVGISDNLNLTGNIRSMYKYIDFCVPCKKNCTIGCDVNCPPIKDFDILPIHVKGLSLQSTETFHSNQSDHTLIRRIATYYVNIKFINVAGSVSSGTSNPVKVDTTPPTCEYIRCVDPTSSMDQETAYIGSNDTIGAYWSCIDDVSDVSQYYVSVIANDSGVVIYKETNVEQSTKAKLTIPTGLYFQHGKSYIVRLRTINTAGLSSHHECSVHVLLYPPSVSDITVTNLFTIPASTSTLSTTFNDRIGITWNNKDDEAEFYELEIGSSAGGQDILPRTKVGLSKAGKVYIKNGRLILNGTDRNITLGTLGNQTVKHSGVQAIKMEPGRCIHQMLFAVGLSHLSSIVNVKTVCVKRSGDVVKQATSAITLNIAKSLANDYFLDQSSIKSDIDNSLVLKISGFVGQVSLGILSDQDLNDEYGSAASIDYVPFIINPKTSLQQTSRTLRNRIISYTGLSFFVSPLSQVDVDRITISINVNQEDFEEETAPILAMWHIVNGKGTWRYIQEECDTQDQTFKLNGGHVTAEICMALFSGIDNKSRRKRSAQTTINTPVQISVLKANQTYSNSAPVIDTKTLRTPQDTPVLEAPLEWHDYEGDDVMFSILKQPDVGVVNLTHKGFLSYFPPIYFVGEVNIQVYIAENSTHNALNNTYTIVITVEDSNDPPIAGFVDNDGTIFDTRKNASTTYKFESNKTFYHLGTFIILDRDANEAFSVLKTVNPSELSKYLKLNVIEDAQQVSVENSSLKIKQEQIESMNQVKLFFEPTANTFGKVTFKFLANDKDTFYTIPFSLEVFILISPCVHGSCTESADNAVPCSDISRSVSFNAFRCNCDDGYEGYWCHIETDECVTAQCLWIHDCVDKIAAYDCNINALKLSMLLLGILAIVVFFILLIVFWKQFRHPTSRKQDNEAISGQIDDKKIGGVNRRVSAAFGNGDRKQEGVWNTNTAFTWTEGNDNESYSDVAPGTKHLKSPSRQELSLKDIENIDWENVGESSDVDGVESNKEDASHTNAAFIWDGDNDNEFVKTHSKPGILPKPHGQPKPGPKPPVSSAASPSRKISNGSAILSMVSVNVGNKAKCQKKQSSNPTIRRGCTNTSTDVSSLIRDTTFTSINSQESDSSNTVPNIDT